jgi:hypothetical protein
MELASNCSIALRQAAVISAGIEVDSPGDKVLECSAGGGAPFSEPGIEVRWIKFTGREFTI